MLYRKELQEWDGIHPRFWPLIARELPPPKTTPFLKSRRLGGLKGGRLEKAWRAFLCPQSRNELERWQESFALSSSRETPFRRLEIELIWRQEFAPRLAPGEGG